MATKHLSLDTVPLDINILSEKRIKNVPTLLNLVSTYQEQTSSLCPLESQIVFQMEEFKRLLSWTFDSGLVEKMRLHSIDEQLMKSRGKQHAQEEEENLKSEKVIKVDGKRTKEKIKKEEGVDNKKSLNKVKGGKIKKSS